MAYIRIAVILNSENDSLLSSKFCRSDLIIATQFNHPSEFEETTIAHDIIVVDTDISGINPLSAIKMLVQKSSHAKIIAICSKPDIKQTRSFLGAGVTGIFLRDEMTCGFAYIAKTVYAGHIVISPLILKAFIAKRLSIYP